MQVSDDRFQAESGWNRPYGYQLIRPYDSQLITPYGCQVIGPYACQLIRPYGCQLITPYACLLIRPYDYQLIRPYGCHLTGLVVYFKDNDKSNMKQQPNLNLLQVRLPKRKFCISLYCKHYMNTRHDTRTGWVGGTHRETQKRTQDPKVKIILYLYFLTPSSSSK
jgi:hypothetical protein